MTVLADNMRNVVIRRDAGRDSPREQHRFERAGKFFMRDDTFLCAHAGLFDKTSVLVMRSSKNRGRELDACSVEVVPQVTKIKGVLA